MNNKIKNYNNWKENKIKKEFKKKFNPFVIYLDTREEEEQKKSNKEGISAFEILVKKNPPIELYKKEKVLIIDDLSFNGELKNIPKEILLFFKDVKRLVIEDKKIKEIPDWISELPDLFSLTIHNCDLKNINEEALKNCPSLYSLAISGSSIPKEEQTELMKNMKRHNIMCLFYKKSTGARFTTNLAEIKKRDKEAKKFISKKD